MTDRTIRRAHLAALRAHARGLRRLSLRGLFEADPQRFARFHREEAGLLVDLSKTHLTDATLDLLLGFAHAVDLEGAFRRMAAGELINTTEGRAALHMALREGDGGRARVAGRPVAEDVATERARFLAFAEDVRSGRFRGADGGPIAHVINLGIGGSDLGPAMATAALAPFADGPRVHFVSNVDPAHLAQVTAELDPRRTLLLVASKTFTTQETMANAEAARAWLTRAVGDRAGQQMAAISTARARVAAFGIPAERQFGFWDWVGGRYSLWSAIGLSLAIAIGRERFLAFLDGAHALDRHVLTAPPARNLPILLALLAVLHRHGFRWPAQAVLPYDQRLARLPAYLQQLDMESLGKRVDLAGRAVPWETGSIIFGEPGTNGQHAFYQLLHQGTTIVPVEILVAARGHEGEEAASRHAMLVAHALAQGEALVRGRTLAEARAQLAAEGRSAAEVRRLAPHKVFPGGRPVVTILYSQLDPGTLGRLLALYEHKVYAQSVLLGINAFDQWGVELGKELAGSLLPMVAGGAVDPARDSSTRGLVAALARLRRDAAGD